MAQVNLGSIKFNWKGAYNAGTAYAIDDVVSYNGSSYVAKTATTGNLPTVTANWDIMSSAGTNGTNGSDGTDVGTTLTTQGDILYRDGSGLQRLPKGTAGQVLQMNSGATAPEYGTVSSDFVKIASVEATSGSKISFNNVFATGTYKSYQAKISRFRPSTGAWVKFYWRDSGSDVTSNYYWVTRSEYGNSSAVGGDTYRGWNDSFGVVTYWSIDNSYDSTMNLYFGNPAYTSGHKAVNCQATVQTNNEIMTMESGFVCNNSTVTGGVDGFSLELSNTGYSMNNVDVEVYGLK